MIAVDDLGILEGRGGGFAMEYLADHCEIFLACGPSGWTDGKHENHGFFLHGDAPANGPP